jgi:hypothetical protein
VVGDTGATGATGASGAASATTYPFCDNTMVRVGGNRIGVHEMMGSDSIIPNAITLTATTAFASYGLFNIHGASGTASHDTALSLTFGLYGSGISSTVSTITNMYLNVNPINLFRCIVCQGFTVLIMRYYVGVPSNPGGAYDTCITRYAGLTSSTQVTGSIVATAVSSIIVVSSPGTAATLRVRVNSATAVVYPMLCAGSSFFGSSGWVTLEFVIEGLTGLFNIKLNGLTCTVTGLAVIPSTLTHGLVPLVSSFIPTCSSAANIVHYVVVDYVHFSSVYIDGDVTV